MLPDRNAPKRIWLYVDTSDDGEQYLELIPEDAHSITDVEYILASDHAALIRESEARAMESAASKLEPAPNAKNGLWANRVRKLQATLRAEAAAIRAAKATP